MAKLDIKAFGLALGIIWAIGAFILGILAMSIGWGNAIVNLCSTVYIGYEATFIGSIIGGAWAFVDAGIGGILVAWLYNKLVR